MAYSFRRLLNEMEVLGSLMYSRKSTQTITHPKLLKGCAHCISKMSLFYSFKSCSACFCCSCVFFLRFVLFYIFVRFFFCGWMGVLVGVFFVVVVVFVVVFFCLFFFLGGAVQGGILSTLSWQVQE